MICQYEYKDGILFVTFPEIVSDNDFHLVSMEFEIIEKEYSVVPNFIVSLKNVNTFNGDYHSVQNLAKQRAQKSFPNNILEAILVTNDFQMGFARMYQTVNDNPHLTIKIFKDEPKAIEWIKSNDTRLTSRSSVTLQPPTRKGFEC
jgi:hypothetical protein